MTAERVERRTQDGTLVALGAWVVYGLVYGPLYALLGEHTGITAFIPVLIAGWYCGAAAGAFAGLMSVPVTLLASRAIGITDDWLGLPVLVGAGAMVVVGYSLGHIRDLREKTLREIRRGEDLESTLGHERQRLAVVNEIAGKLRGDRTVEHVVSEAVATLHKHFPKFRASYSTVDAEGRVTNLVSARPGESLSSSTPATPLVLSPTQVEGLLKLDLYQVDDVTKDVSWSKLANVFDTLGIAALLDAPIRHPGVKTGLLSFSASEAHEWTDLETRTLRDAADCLEPAIADAERRRLLKESESRFRGILDQHHYGVTVVVDGGIVYANPAMTEIFEYRREQLLGLDPAKLIAPRHHQRFINHVAQCQTDNGERAGVELEALRQDGTPFPLMAVCQPMVFEGHPAILGTLRDLTADKKAEEKLRQTEASLHILLEQHFDGVAVMANQRFLYVNRALGSIFGYEREELINRDPVTLVSESERSLAAGWLGGPAAGAVPTLTVEYSGVKKDGTTFPLEILARVTDFSGQNSVLATFRDLTERKRVEAAVREAEAKYRNLVEHSLAGVYIIQNRRFVYVNPKLAEILGYTQDELLALPSAAVAVITESDRNLVEDRVEARLSGTTDSNHYYAQARRKSGEVIDLEVHGGTTSYISRPAVIGTVLDVTERLRAEAQLRESEVRFRALFEEAPIGLVMAAPDTVIQMVNEAFCDMLGYSESELVGRRIHEITHPEDAAGTPESAAKVFDDAQSIVRLQKRYVRKDGTTVQAETTVSMVNDERGRPVYAVAMIEDVTEQRRLESQLQQVLRLESVGQLAGGVAHNFNNALTAISGYSELLARRFSSEDPALRDLEQIQRVAERSAQLTRQLLAFSRHEDVHPSIFNVNEAVESTRDLLSPLLDHQLRFRVRLDQGLPSVNADRSQLEQIITNLVINARDAMPEGGLLTIDTEAVDVDEAAARVNPEASPGRYVRLVVRDTGVGMEEDTVARIFEPFFTTKEPGEGIGLGLAMVHGAVKQGGGFITVESTPDVGSTFAVFIPEFTEPDAAGRDSGVTTPTVH